jgi:hypothetical protein
MLLRAAMLPRYNSINSYLRGSSAAIKLAVQGKARKRWTCRNVYLRITRL